MRSYTCVCGGDLYFQSTTCVRCGRTVGMCPVCLTVAPAVGKERSRRCGNPDCNAEITPCRHRLDYHWCNRWVDRNETNATPIGPGGVTNPAAAALCIDCRLTTHLPDLSQLMFRDQVKRTEFAKQRTLYPLRIIGLPIGGPGDPLPLTFQLLHDGKTPVTTGHDNGVITINLREADPVQREAARVRFGEPQRTLVGHFRHELGHYYWDLLVQNDPQTLASFRGQFGDERQPDYAFAMNAYYAAPPRSGWNRNFVSAYATMHPWEDFAETFNAYLDMRAVLATAAHFGIRQRDRPADSPGGNDENRSGGNDENRSSGNAENRFSGNANDSLSGNAAGRSDDQFDAMMFSYMSVGLVANELNRDLGLTDLVPEVFTKPVRAKLRWIDDLVRRHARPRILPGSKTTDQRSDRGGSRADGSNDAAKTRASG